MCAYGALIESGCPAAVSAVVPALPVLLDRLSDKVLHMTWLLGGFVLSTLFLFGHACILLLHLIWLLLLRLPSKLCKHGCCTSCPLLPARHACCCLFWQDKGVREAAQATCECLVDHLGGADVATAVPLLLEAMAPAKTWQVSNALRLLECCIYPPKMQQKHLPSG